MIDYEIVIIGGGVAGLYAAIECGKLGISTIVIEGGNYPSHKVCGEFISSESLPKLQKIGIHPILIEKASFDCNNTHFLFSFPKPAGGLSHITLDPQLLKIAKSFGVTVLTDTKVEIFHPKASINHHHQVILSNGDTLICSQAIIATGKIPSFTAPLKEPKYIGIKAHFSKVDLNHTLEMFSFKEAYLGISPIEDNKVNLAGLISFNRFKKARSIEELIQELLNENPHLQQLLSNGKCCFDKWMSTFIPSFGFKETPDWLDTLFIGDAALTIPPASGEGLSLALTTAELAVQHAFSRNSHLFKKRLHTRFYSQMFVAKALHKIMLSPFLNRIVLKSCSRYPVIAEYLFKTSRKLI